MKKLQEKQKKWLLAKSRTAIRKLQKKKKQNRRNKSNVYIKKGDPINVKVPSHFSIINNAEVTLKFFNYVYGIIDRLNFKDRLYFDFTEVEEVTVDAIMYLIALIKNTKRLIVRQIECSGNVPIKEEPKKVIETCGFYKFVQPQYKVNYTGNPSIKISSGHSADAVLVGKICDFIHENSRLNRIDTKSIFPMIMELMTNTIQHAYRENNYIKDNWYIFAENGESQFQFVFLDTGLGIPNTIRTNFYEKIKSIVNKNDASLISSSLKGVFRTETKLGYRGKGMPEIYDRISKGIISDFSIVSCRGMCNVDLDGAIHEKKMSYDLKGTLFCWKVNKI